MGFIFIKLSACFKMATPPSVLFTLQLLLQRYNLLTGSYSTLGLAYKYLLKLSFTQVACERSFSVLKYEYIKSRLRCNLGQSKLESFMLMSSEKETLMKLDVS